MGGDDESLLAARIDNRFVRLENNRLLSARIQQRSIRGVVLWWKSELNLRLARLILSRQPIED